MIHIAPWAACLGLLRGAARVLPPGGLLYLYGPFMRGGQHTAPSNEAFDASLKARDPSWGIRDVADIEKVAAENGFSLNKIVEMPANNLSLVFVKAGLVSVSPEPVVLQTGPASAASTPSLSTPPPTRWRWVAS